MLLPIVFVAVLVLLCVYGLVRWTRLTAVNVRIIDAPAGEPEPEGFFRGGVMGQHIMTSGTLARLELFDWGVRLRGTVISRWAVPAWEARYDELAMAELVALPTSRIAVWLRLRDGEPRSIGFLSDHSPEVLNQLQAHGVPVNRSVTQISRVQELYPQPGQSPF
ncbi:MAG: hypothetical protein ABJB47_11090 [Actinomycetota bacterium]